MPSGEPAHPFARTDGPTAPIRLGIAGLGLAGAFMIRAAAAHPRIALWAAMDPLERPRQAFARDFGARTYGRFEDLCSDPSIEVIYVASPHQHHAQQAVEALQHGKHVLVEKPLALTLEDCDRVIAAAERTGLNVIVGHTHAFDPNIRHMRALIESGEVGRLGMILSFNYNAAAPPRGTRPSGPRRHRLQPGDPSDRDHPAARWRPYDERARQHGRAQPGARGARPLRGVP